MSRRSTSVGVGHVVMEARAQTSLVAIGGYTLTLWYKSLKDIPCSCPNSKILLVGYS